MATNLDIDDRAEPRHGVHSAPAGEDTGPHELTEADDESNGYIEYLDEPEVLEALARARRENPGALIHLEPHPGELWSLQVYRSEAAKEAFRVHFFYQQMALASLSRRQNGEHANNT
jgi:hypothetical protein